MDEKEIREKLWAAHPCIGKYGDDGELQCNHFPFIDFKRDTWRDISAGITAHIRQDAIKKVGENLKVRHFTEKQIEQRRGWATISFEEIEALCEGVLTS